MKLFIGFVVATSIAYLATRAQVLDRSGGIAAAGLGTIVFGLGGVGWALVMLSFFISSSLLSKLFTSYKQSSHINFSKGSRRDAWQVAANGGVAGIMALSYFVHARIAPADPLLPALWIGFAASLAGANADTWATELGLLNPGEPILISSLRKVPKGFSGGVSLVGTIASLAGSALIGGVTVTISLAGWGPSMGIKFGLQFLIITLSGLVGALIDSLLGGTLQSIYYCSTCEKETEQHPLHTCGTATRHHRGVRWFNNDWVNAACTLGAGTFGLLLSSLLI